MTCRRSEHASTGVYFLANDPVYDLTLAFLNSFRAHMPRMPACMIPFDDQIGRLRKLTETYNFVILDNSSLLSRCDAISVRFHDRTKGHYRKLAAWEGPFDQFIYIDVDTVLLSDAAIVLKFLSKYSFIASQSRLPGLRRWVWKDSMLSAGALSADQLSYSANTGFLCSHMGALNLAKAEDAADSAITFAPHMELLCFEQPFLNYLMVTSGLPYTSLLELRASTGAENLPQEIWAGEAGGIFHHGNFRMLDVDPILLVHWNGQWLRKPAREVVPDDLSSPLLMPYDNLWSYYFQLRSDKRIE